MTREEQYLTRITGEDVETPEPILRKEQYLSAIGNGSGRIPELPTTREERYLAILAGENYEIPTPETRLEQYMAKACGLEIDVSTPITRVEQLWAKIAEAGDWKVTEITGELPLAFLSDGSVLVDYKIYGTSAGAGVETESGEPHGYKLPLTVESGAQSQDIPIYIGPSKLGEEEYVDFGEQKVYKRTENLFDKDAKDASRGYMAARQFDSDGTTSNKLGWYISEYIKVEPSTNYYLIRRMTSPYTTGYVCFYDINKSFIRSLSLSSEAFVTYSDEVYIRFDSPVSLKADTMLTATAEKPSSYIPYLQPTDPPVPLQPIPTYKGENALSSTEMLDEVTVKGRIKERPIVYGWHVDPSISDPAQAVTYLVDAVGKTPAAMGSETFSYGDWENAFFMPKPCMLRSDGTVDYYLDPNDYAKKADRTASDIADPNYDGNAMMEWPLIWWKYEAGETEGEGYFYVTNRKVDDSFNCWCNYNCDDKIVSHFYTAIYNGTGTSKTRSISGVALTSANGNGGTTATQEITRATANNTTDKTEWYIDVWSDRMLINGLLILMGKSLNSQAVFGRGLDTGSQSAKEAYVTGSLNDKGLFWGNTSAGTSGVKVFGMENYWGCVWHRTAGLIGLSNGNTAYKLTYGTADGTTADGYNTNGNGYLIDTTARPANGYFKTAKFGKFGYLPLTTGGSSTTDYSDYWYTNNSALTFALGGGSANYGVYDGCSYFYLHSTPGYANWSISSSLSCKPLAKTTPEPELIPTDPPVPLPPVPTYKGENTLSSTETLGEVTVKGRIKEAGDE